MVGLVGCRSDVVLGTIDAGPDASLDAATPSTPSRIGSGSRIPWNGGRYFVLGANLPWVGFSTDFGGADGLSSAFTRGEAEAALATAQADGARVVRWTMFTAAEDVIPIPYTLDGDGRVTGFRPDVLDDVDTALTLAATYDVYLILVVFTYDAPSAARLADPTERAGLADAIASVEARGRSSGRLLAVEVSPYTGALADRDALLAAAAARMRPSATYLSTHVVNLEEAASACASGADFVGFTHQSAPVRIDARTLRYDAVDPAPGCPLLVDIIYLDVPNADEALVDIVARGWAGALGWVLRVESVDPQVGIDGTATTRFAANEPATGPP